MAVDEHEAFLGTIFKRPEDVTARLVYADWLDENDHPGGELIRVRQQLALPDLPKTKRTTLIARERKLLAKCDGDWLVQIERADWKLRYLRLRPEDEDAARWAKRRQGHWSVPAQRVIRRAVAEFETEVGRPLPRSWKSFAHGCGQGQLCGWYDLYAPRRVRDGLVALRREWSAGATGLVAHADYHWLPAEIRPWLAHSVQFGRSDNCDFLVWNTSRVTDPIRSEYEVALLNNRDLHIMETFESFEALWEHGVGEYGPDYNVPCFQPN